MTNPMNNLRRNWLAIAVGVVMCSAIPAALAQTTNYGNFAGATVVYTDVTEYSGTDPLPLFNAPIIAGNTLDFNPTFSSFAENGSDTTDGQLSFGIDSMSGNAIDELVLSEGGAYTMVGNGSAFVDVTAVFYIDIYAVDFAGPGTSPLVSLTNSMTFSPNPDGTILHTPVFTQGQWSGGVSIDINDALVQAGVDFEMGATLLSVTLDNTLVAYSSADGTTSFIDKKDFKGFSITVVPEPSSIALALLSLGGLGLRIFRNRNNH